MYKTKDNESSFELTIWKKEMGSNSVVEQTYLKPFILDQHYEVAVTRVHLPHSWFNMEPEDECMLITMKGKRLTLRAGYYKTVADVARGIQETVGGDVKFERNPSKNAWEISLR